MEEGEAFLHPIDRRMDASIPIFFFAFCSAKAASLFYLSEFRSKLETNGRFGRSDFVSISIGLRLFAVGRFNNFYRGKKPFVSWAFDRVFVEEVFQGYFHFLILATYYFFFSAKKSREINIFDIQLNWTRAALIGTNIFFKMSIEGIN